MAGRLARIGGYAQQRGALPESARVKKTPADASLESAFLTFSLRDDYSDSRFARRKKMAEQSNHVPVPSRKNRPAKAAAVIAQHARIFIMAGLIGPQKAGFINAEPPPGRFCLHARSCVGLRKEREQFEEL